MLENSQKFNVKNYNTCKQCMLTIFEYWCPNHVVLGTTSRHIVSRKDQDKHDEHNQEVVMLIKLLVIDDMLPQVPYGKPSAKI